MRKITIPIVCLIAVVFCTSKSKEWQDTENNFHTYKCLDKTEYLPKPGQAFEQTIQPEVLMAVVAMDTVTCERIDLSGFISGNQLSFHK